MATVVASGADADEVAVRVTTEEGAVEGVSIYFNRAPHSSCVGKSGKDGLATCHLVDQHGDGDAHEDDGAVAVVATFPGDVRADRVIAPTTLVLAPGR
jgi:hypothetical protein